MPLAGWDNPTKTGQIKESIEQVDDGRGWHSCAKMKKQQDYMVLMSSKMLWISETALKLTEPPTILPLPEPLEDPKVESVDVKTPQALEEPHRPPEPADENAAALALLEVQRQEQKEANDKMFALQCNMLDIPRKQRRQSGTIKGMKEEMHKLEDKIVAISSEREKAQASLKGPESESFDADAEMAARISEVFGDGSKHVPDEAKSRVIRVFDTIDSSLESDGRISEGELASIHGGDLFGFLKSLNLLLHKREGEAQSTAVDF